MSDFGLDETSVLKQILGAICCGQQYDEVPKNETRTFQWLFFTSNKNKPIFKEEFGRLEEGVPRELALHDIVSDGEPLEELVLHHGTCRN